MPGGCCHRRCIRPCCRGHWGRGWRGEAWLEATSGTDQVQIPGYVCLRIVLSGTFGRCCVVPAWRWPDAALSNPHLVLRVCLYLHLHVHTWSPPPLPRHHQHRCWPGPAWWWTVWQASRWHGLSIDSTPHTSTHRRLPYSCTRCPDQWTCTTSPHAPDCGDREPWARVPQRWPRLQPCGHRHCPRAHCHHALLHPFPHPFPLLGWLGPQRSLCGQRCNRGAHSHPVHKL